jgi:hypothetical protein
MNTQMKGGEYMQLLTEELRKKLPALYSQENEEDPMVYIKFFDPVGSWTWYANEGEQKGEDFLFFGLVIGFEAELGYFTLNELKNAKNRVSGIQAMPIERDLYFTPCRLSKVKKQHNLEHGRKI